MEVVVNPSWLINTDLSYFSSILQVGEAVSSC